MPPRDNGRGIMLPVVPVAVRPAAVCSSTHISRDVMTVVAVFFRFTVIVIQQMCGEHYSLQQMSEIYSRGDLDAAPAGFPLLRPGEIAHPPRLMMLRTVQLITWLITCCVCVPVLKCTDRCYFCK